MPVASSRVGVPVVIRALEVLDKEELRDAVGRVGEGRLEDRLLKLDHTCDRLFAVFRGPDLLLGGLGALSQARRPVAFAGAISLTCTAVLQIVNDNQILSKRSAK